MALRHRDALVPVGFRTTKEQRDKLNEEAEKRNVDASAIIRGLIDGFLRAAK